MSFHSLNIPPAWVPGMNPEEHPLWSDQVQHERDMMVNGAEKFQERIVTATERGKLGQLQPVQQLALNWLPNVVTMLREDMAAWRKQRGVRPLALKYLEELDVYQAALVGLRAILNHIGTGTASLQTLALEMGRTLEYEQRVRHWEKDQPELYYATQKAQDRQKATASHRRLVNIHEFNKLNKDRRFGDGDQWVAWGREVHFRVGWAILDAIVRATGMFTKEIDTDKQATSRGFSTPMRLTFKPELQKWFSDMLRHTEANTPTFWPTIIPPKRWEGTRDGGYYTPYVKAPALVRFSASSEAQKFKAMDEYDSLDMGQTVPALNLLQETGYRVNSAVLEVVNSAWHHLKLHGKTLPKQTEEALPPRTSRMAAHDEAVKAAKRIKGKPPEPDKQTAEEIAEWKHQASHVYATNGRIVGLGRSTEMTIDMANDLNARDEFFYPHKLDFRGRMYPIPGFLQPQGNDLARGLLSYSSSVPVTSDNGGIDALAIHVANQFGKDKLPNRERVQWVTESADMFRQIAKDPISFRHLWMNDGTENFQALAGAFEWDGFLTAGEGFMSSLPVMVDGTCNGLQHLSALTRDELTGAYVNLVPGDRPQDVYRYAAVEVQEPLMIDAKGRGPNREVAQWWLDVVGGDLPRSLTKRQVMVLPYGGTKESYFEYTRAWLFEERYEVVRNMSKEQVRAGVIYMANLMWSIIGSKLPGAMRTMKWLQDVASIACEEDQPIYWQVPTGFTVRHFYGKKQATTIKSFLDGTRVELTLSERTPKLSKQEQLQGISPNFIHSLDASCLTRTAATLGEAGLQAFTSVHDAYGTHAGNMGLVRKHLRDAFVWVHEHDLLGMFRESAINVIEPTLVLKGLDPLEAREKASDMVDRKAGRLDMGRLDLQGVRNSEYFFA